MRRSRKAAQRLSSLFIVGLLWASPYSGKAGSTDDLPAHSETTDAYHFYGGFYDGSLRSRVPPPVYDPDPGHLWNRLFATLYVRPLRPSSRDSGGLSNPRPLEPTTGYHRASRPAFWSCGGPNTTATRPEGSRVETSSNRRSSPIPSPS